MLVEGGLLCGPHHLIGSFGWVNLDIGFVCASTEPGSNVDDFGSDALISALVVDALASILVPDHWVGAFTEVGLEWAETPFAHDLWLDGFGLGAGSVLDILPSGPAGERIEEFVLIAAATGVGWGAIESFIALEIANLDAVVDEALASQTIEVLVRSTFELLLAEWPESILLDHVIVEEALHDGLSDQVVSPAGRVETILQGLGLYACALLGGWIDLKAISIVTLVLAVAEVEALASILVPEPVLASADAGVLIKGANNKVWVFRLWSGVPSERLLDHLAGSPAWEAPHEELLRHAAAWVPWILNHAVLAWLFPVADDQFGVGHALARQGIQETFSIAIISWILRNSGSFSCNVVS